MSADVFRWEEPPRARHAVVRDWRSIAAALKARPGEWAVVAVCATQANSGQTAAHVRKSAYEALHGARYEAKSRTVNGEYRVYARYMGETSPEVKR